MGALTCPQCQKRMTMDFNTNKVFCTHCGYIRTDDIATLDNKAQIVKAQQVNRPHVEITHRGEISASAMAAFETGQDYFAKGDKDAALQNFQRSVDYQPDFIDGHVWIAKCCDDEKMIRDHLSIVLGYAPSHLEALRLLMVLNGRLTPEQAANTYHDNDQRVQQADGDITAKATELLCPQCGGHLTTNDDFRRVECRFCGYSGSQSTQQAGHDILAMALLERKAKPIKWNVGKRLVTCQQCGAQHTIPAEKMSQRCRFCGSTQVILNDALDSFEEPDGVIPFRLTDEEAMERINQQLNSAGERLANLFNTNKVQRSMIEGVYLPYWVFDVAAEIIRTRNSEFASQTYSDGIDEEPDVAISAVKSPPPHMIAQIGKFDMDDIVTYEPKWLAKYPAEMYTIDVDKASLEARGIVSKIMQRKHNRVIENNSMEDRRNKPVESVRVYTQIQSMNYQLILVPVWIAHLLEVDNEIRTALVNGQTGKVSLGKSHKVDQVKQ
jgi:DNA-directed RNA polymerase subunit RPC12/RpoP